MKVVREWEDYTDGDITDQFSNIIKTKSKNSSFYKMLMEIYISGFVAIE